MKHLIIGYHGASKELLQELSQGEFDLEKSNSDGWLGPGLYFWEQDEFQAWKWAKKRYPNDCAVFKAQINLSNSTLDLTTREAIADYRSFVKGFMADKTRREEFEKIKSKDAFGDKFWLPLLTRSYEEASGKKILALRAVVLTGDIAYSDYDASGESSLTAYTDTSDSANPIGSRVVTRMNIIVALLSKVPIEYHERSFKR